MASLPGGFIHRSSSSMASVFLSAFVVLAFGDQSFDLVIALTGGGQVCHRSSRNIYVYDGVFRGDLGRRQFGYGDDDDHFRDCCAVSLFRIEGEA